MTTTDLKFTPGNKQRGLGWQRALTQPKTSPGPFEAKDFPGSGERVWARDDGMPGPNPLRIWAGKMCSCFARRSLCFPGHQRTNAATECYATAYAAAYANGNILDCCANSCPDSCSDSKSKSNSRGKILTDVICLCFVESSSSTHHDTSLLLSAQQTSQRRIWPPNSRRFFILRRAATFIIVSLCGVNGLVLRISSHVLYKRNCSRGTGVHDQHAITGFAI